MSKKPWGGRFSGKTDKIVEKFTASIGFDKRLYKHDIMGSIAHCKVLEKCKILSSVESQKIIKGLKSIEKSIDNGSFQFDSALEDIHMNIERELIDKIGAIGGKLQSSPKSQPPSPTEPVYTHFRTHEESSITLT